ncbi:histidine kinase [Fulvivirgaceae bacterium BMA10]|uniref:Histidine kinase n=1 Tax=Splendidivirga corallicola TaxID=3051826 RepID=A0ABT8KM39_9BACT|nr:histidine kinase [Fulvivirgaceae bacterium BMA10]
MRNKTKFWIITSAGILLAIFVVWLGIKTQPRVEFYISLIWIGIVIALLWFGNKFISKKLDKKLPWLTHAGYRFFTQLLLTIVYSLLCLNVSYRLFKNIFTQDPPSLEQLIVMNVFGSLLIIPIFSIYFGVHLLKSWRKSEIETERLHKENVRSQLEALKNHLDPHFLFNNLNILSSLIDRDTELSKKYLEKFAEVYRIILQNEVSDLVSLAQELEFVKAYMYLIEIRFENNIHLNIDVPKELKLRSLPPLTLQMLIENSIKHNVVSEKKQLTITVASDGNDYLIIRNNLAPKRSVTSNSNGSGLKNIMNRYSYYTDDKVLVEKTEDHFIVSVPLLEIEEI